MTTDPADLIGFGLLGVVEVPPCWPLIQNALEVPKHLESLRAYSVRSCASERAA
jgi:hypothetical protein